MLFQSCGIIDYSNFNPLIVKVDSELTNYYRSLIPKYFRIQKPLHSPHISVTRKIPKPNLFIWKTYHNKNVIFDYDPFIYNDETYFWLNAYSDLLESIRLELGIATLDKYKDNNKYRFHITLGNIKHHE